MMHGRQDTHREFWDLIPWHVNGRIGEEDRRRLVSHLEACGACRTEWQLQRQIHRSMNEENGVEYIPSASLKLLQDKLCHPAGGSPPAAQPPPAAVSGRTPWQAAMAACVVITASALLLVAAALSSFGGHGAPATYHTVTDPAPHAPTEVIRAVFSASMTLAELQDVLDRAGLQIVAGPTEAGVYSLASTDSRPNGRSLAQLRASAGVRFAESATPVTAAGGGP